MIYVEFIRLAKMELYLSEKINTCIKSLWTMLTSMTILSDVRILYSGKMDMR